MNVRLHSGAAERNREPIAVVLERELPAAGSVLEIASGSGQHIVHFAARLPGLDWQPSDPDAAARASVSARVREAARPNLREPLALDVHAPSWPIDSADALVCVNMIHIAPWSATAALFSGAARLLRAGAPIVLYGPFRRDGSHTSGSNAAFDADLRARDPAWGVRDLEAVDAVARETGFARRALHEMPANNLCVVYVRL